MMMVQIHPFLPMDLSFKFPVYHKRCDSCESRYKCWTENIHYTYSIGNDGFYRDPPLSLYLPSELGLKCFEISPYNMIDRMELKSTGNPDGGMKLEVWWH